MNLVKITEAGAIAASRYIGSGDKVGADTAALEAMQSALATVDWTGVIKASEGNKDFAPMFALGQVVGRNQPGDVPYDVAIDTIDGTTQTVNGGAEAISVMAVSNQNTMWNTMVDGEEQHYVLKLAVGAALKEAKMKVTDSFISILETSAKTLNKPLSQLMVCMLNRPRHVLWVEQARSMGVKVKLIQDCDLMWAVNACWGRMGIDLYYGVGGATEAVLSAAAINCLGFGDLQVIPANVLGQVTGKTALGLTDLVSGPCSFAATGILDGSMLDGVGVKNGKDVTYSLVMNSKSIQFLETRYTA